MKRLGLLVPLLLIWAAASAATPGGVAALKNSGALDRLVKGTGVYNAAPGGKTPGFVADPSWPQPLPHNWILGQIGGLYVDAHDHIWVYNRPRTLTNDEAALEGALAGAADAKGAPASGLGFARSNGPVADCCRAAPSVLEFDVQGKLLRAWGGPADPGFMQTRCREDQGCIWPNLEHGIYVDNHDNVWLAGSSGKVPTDGSAWITNAHGGDGLVLKFDVDGHFKMRIGGTPTGPNSNDTNSGVNGTPTMYMPADMVVDPATNRLYVADGYGNRRVLIVDATSGQYIGHFGAYGNNPVDDAAAAAAGRWPPAYAKGERKPAFFRNPVHCVKIADDGKIYVCDRGNDRIQVFDKNDPALGKPCANPTGEAGKCGFVAEQFISERTETLPVMPGTSVSMNFSRDKGQSCLYVGDNTNQTIYILDRKTLRELGRLGSGGRETGQFHWLHQVSLDSRGDIFTAEVDTGKRIQKFVRYGPSGCGGAGFPTVGGPAER
jgi:DNA-binding beta-propeller fold protein YncE